MPVSCVMIRGEAHLTTALSGPLTRVREGSRQLMVVPRRWYCQEDRKKERKGSRQLMVVPRRWYRQVDRKKERKVGFREPGYPGSRLLRHLSLWDLGGTPRPVNRRKALGWLQGAQFTAERRCADIEAHSSLLTEELGWLRGAQSLVVTEEGSLLKLLQAEALGWLRGAQFTAERRCADIEAHSSLLTEELGWLRGAQSLVVTEEGSLLKLLQAEALGWLRGAQFTAERRCADIEAHSSLLTEELGWLRGAQS
ncbi:hypothetical protein NDU88_000050 [Pleurodeles waltl]|uniref:Uncharacterized protein n=1 Tax=Pleurodeles waltl TaxID=8319 RepID=A0AAV7SVS7_PLEWA|nr:hypothetical protein NDU88_000050 [Pleurodeles waltl]